MQENELKQLQEFKRKVIERATNRVNETHELIVKWLGGFKNPNSKYEKPPAYLKNSIEGIADEMKFIGIEDMKKQYSTPAGVNLILVVNCIINNPSIRLSPFEIKRVEEVATFLDYLPQYGEKTYSEYAIECKEVLKNPSENIVENLKAIASGVAKQHDAVEPLFFEVYLLEWLASEQESTFPLDGFSNNEEVKYISADLGNRRKKYLAGEINSVEYAINVASAYKGLFAEQPKISSDIWS